MTDTIYQLLSLDLPPFLSAVFAAASCSLLGNFLVLRRVSLMGDAISHAVLPGIVIAFLVSGSRSSLPIFIGAALAGVLTTLLVELVRRLGRMEAGAAMGVVFSLLFALGVLLIEQAAARNIDLDADCLLHGQLESIFWYPPETWAQFLSLSTIALLPSEVITSICVFALCVLFVLALYKELKIAVFDPALATALGFNANALHLCTMVLVAGAVVAAFEIVGSILVIAMIICPPATARLLTDKLRTQIILSLIVSTLAVLCGYVAGAFVPIWLGYQHSISIAGMITVACGTAFGIAVVCAPQHGVVAKAYRRLSLASQMLADDVLGLLFRAEELAVENGASSVKRSQIMEILGDQSRTRRALLRLVNAKLACETDGTYRLTDAGRVQGLKLVRAHRLWENYLVERGGLAPEQVHRSAHTLEHFTSPDLGQRLAEQQDFPSTDPHGKPIPAAKVPTT